MAIYIMMKNMDMVDREDLIQWDMRDTSGHGRKIKKKKKKNMKMNSFPIQSIEWDGKVVCTENTSFF